MNTDHWDRLLEKAGCMDARAASRPIDILAQFGKLFPSYSRNIDMTMGQILELVEAHLATEGGLSENGHWAYDINRHLALLELRDAMKAQKMRYEQFSSALLNRAARADHVKGEAV